MTILKTTLAVALALGANVVLAEDKKDDNVDSIKEAIAEGEAHLNLRYRYENVDQDNALDDADASTVRTRLTFKTKKVNDFSATFEVDNVSKVGVDDYSLPTDAIKTHSVVADPTGSNINQAALSYTGLDNTAFTFGRQRVNLDNQRHVGGVAFRQHEQTYDAFSMVNTSIKDMQFVYAYVYNVNSILNSDIDTETHLLNYNWKASDMVQVSAYGYMLDLVDAPDASTQTLGFRIVSPKKAKSNFIYAAEYAKQTDYADSTKDLSANYYLVEAGYKFEGWTAKLGHEVLTGDANNAGHAFQTPLATKHKFQGWSDVFLTTPDAGVEDTYLSVSTKLSGNKLAVVYHDYSAEDGSQSYGDEIGLVFSRKLNDEYGVSVKYSDYSADQLGVDTRKIWFTFSANY